MSSLAILESKHIKLKKKKLSFYLILEIHFMYKFIISNINRNKIIVFGVFEM
jgi:hypothetical protein